MDGRVDTDRRSRLIHHRGKGESGVAAFDDSNLGRGGVVEFEDEVVDLAVSCITSLLNGAPSQVTLL